MTILCIHVDNFENDSVGEALTIRLNDVVSELVSADRSHIVKPIEGGLLELRVAIEEISEPQAERFVDRMIALSRSSGRAFTISVTLDEAAHLKQIEKYPSHILGDEHVVHVRPSEGTVLHGYFRYLFGAP